VSKQCPGCAETVDSAKAFCPGCGHAFEGEQSPQHISGFDKMDSTVQMGQTMYNQMLSEMQLDISKVRAVKNSVDLQPAAVAPPRQEGSASKPAPASAGSRILWLILGAMTLIILIGIALLIIVYRAR
jgi:hypothetical protein